MGKRPEISGKLIKSQWSWELEPILHADRVKKLLTKPARNAQYVVNKESCLEAHALKSHNFVTQLATDCRWVLTMSHPAQLQNIGLSSRCASTGPAGMMLVRLPSWSDRME
ncbi:hypothetical protein A6X21_20370 [Planctopirus hydrillae]|uniref:Uncharacterized protein n=1 Tax=Planctopirus hydrillae TaxID=1841610 RepID=A0A1C3EHJ2_9PLAN|nr:hypothetical protein A6X21_20370 [Planctopirus hydrillae]